MSQKLPVNNFDWMKDISQFNEGFLKNYNVESDERHFFEVDDHILKNYMNFIMIYHFLLERMKSKKSKSLLLIWMEKTEYVIHIRNLKQALNHG